MKVLILGDCHGAIRRVHDAVREGVERHQIGLAIQVGDFGFYAPTMQAIKPLRAAQGNFARPLLVIDGNHEDHRFLKHHDSLHSKMNLHYQPRGSVKSIGTMSFGFMGGALNIDRPQEWDGPQDDPYWSNWPTERQIDAAIELWNDLRPEVIVTHSCPAEIGVRMPGLKAAWVNSAIYRFIEVPGFPVCREDDPGDLSLTRLWRGLKYRPRHWLFGHFHNLRQQEIEGCTFTCVGSSDGSDGSRRIRPVILDTKDLSLEIFPQPMDGLCWALPREEH